ncbi:MAG: hypothetical protein G01um10147_124 [Microgenomates group bacterium Gr01-1014_7]|nr:MAG: hypothetical protein G01um10147_124 [Microgenomates group bacterium Gr01-1014_7]
MIGERAELGMSRDQLLFARWITLRANYEQRYLSLLMDPGVPALAIRQHEEEMHQLDVMLSHGPARMSFWGEDVEEEARGGLRMLEKYLDEIRAGKDQLELNPKYFNL